MDIVFGNRNHCTKLETEDRKVAIALDKGDKLSVILGINRVQIEHINGEWVITHGSNVANKLLPQSDDNAFFKYSVDLSELNQ